MEENKLRTIEQMESDAIIATLVPEVQKELIALRKDHIVFASLNNEGQIQISVTKKKPLLN